MTHFSERIPVVKRHMTVLGTKLQSSNYKCILPTPVSYDFVVQFLVCCMTKRRLYRIKTALQIAYRIVWNCSFFLYCTKWCIQCTVRCNLKLQDEEIQFSDGSSVGQSNKKFFELTPVEFEVKDSFTSYDINVHQENSDDRRYVSLISACLIMN